MKSEMFINANYLWTVETNDTPYNWNPDNIIRIINPREMSHPVIENDIIYIQFNSIHFNSIYGIIPISHVPAISNSSSCLVKKVFIVYSTEDSHTNFLMECHIVETFK